MKYVSGACIEDVKITGAYTIKPIVYQNHLGYTILVPVNVYIIVDIAEGIALIGEDHVDINKDEYQAA